MLNEAPADERDHAFQRLCHEAVLACGPNIAAIESYVWNRLEALAPEDRARIRRELALVLAGGMTGGPRRETH